MKKQIFTIILLLLIVFSLHLPVTIYAITTRSANFAATSSPTLKRSNVVPTKAVAGKLTWFNGPLAYLSGSTLKVNNYTINVVAATKILRRFGGKSALSEFTLGDSIYVLGKTSATDPTVVTAQVIRDQSIQKRNGVFIGTITSLKPGTGEFIMSTQIRGDQNVAPDKNTVYKNRKNQSMVFGDLKVGDRVRVRGLWDNKTNMLTQVVTLKDYSQPQ